MNRKEAILLDFTPKRNDSERDQDKERASFIKSLIIVVAIALAIRFFVIETVRIEGPSMQPTLYSDEWIMLDKISYKFSKPERFDIVVCRFEGDNATYVKRVIALEGETVEIKNGEVYINGSKLNDTDYANGISNIDYPPVTVPEGHVYVLGDNRGDSYDSRARGFVNANDILGKGIIILWPLNKISLI
jgi:signal peptidase I